jgi:hypothetical protein
VYGLFQFFRKREEIVKNLQIFSLNLPSERRSNETRKYAFPLFKLPVFFNTSESPLNLRLRSKLSFWLAKSEFFYREIFTGIKRKQSNKTTVNFYVRKLSFIYPTVNFFVSNSIKFLGDFFCEMLKSPLASTQWYC